MRRATFLKTLAAGLAGAGLGTWGLRKWAFPAESQRLAADIPVQIHPIGWKHGHLLRDGFAFPEPEQSHSASVVIVGGGITGLVAAWTLQRQGVKDIVLLELEENTGGNAAWGETDLGKHPWGAHYLPVPDPENRDLIALLDAFGAIEGYNDAGLPLYREEFLCAAPEERLLLHGRWQEGLVPREGLPAEDLRQINDFGAFVHSLKGKTGSDGKRLFRIPVAECSADPAWTALDQMTMQQWLLAQGWTSEYLHWYVNYCMADDYGTAAADVSAWAGLHYFSARTGKCANAEDDAVLTWPEGNGWLAERLRAQLTGVKVQTGQLVYKVSAESGRGEVRAFSPATGKTAHWAANAVVMAVPQFVARRLTGQPDFAPLAAMSYAPWLVANVHLNRFPERGNAGYPPAWDNVVYGRQSLGYVRAAHQVLRQEAVPGLLPETWTFYQALTGDPKNARQMAFERTESAWRDQILAELRYAHTDIVQQIRRIDLRVWGHAMIRPVPGYLWGEARKSAANPLKMIHFAHTDLSGMSLFEEATWQGMQVANRVTEFI